MADAKACFRIDLDLLSPEAIETMDTNVLRLEGEELFSLGRGELAERSDADDADADAGTPSRDSLPAKLFFLSRYLYFDFPDLLKY
jgi:hypothetical protein